VRRGTAAAVFAALLLLASGASGCSKETNNCKDRAVCGKGNDSNGLSDEAAGSDGAGEDPSADSADFSESPGPSSTDEGSSPKTPPRTPRTPRRGTARGPSRGRAPCS
jgi:hypothetical protein